MDDRPKHLGGEFEERWREWTRTEPALDETQLKRKLMERTRERRLRHRTPLVLAAAAAGLVVVLVVLESTRRWGIPISSPEVDMIHETSDNVILVLREDRNPIYVVTDSSTAREGERP